jgi:C1A family cysteine protease
VVLVAYDNDARYWVLRNSWGPGFGTGGYFRVSGGG